jgi:hypothetical protein
MRCSVSPYGTVNVPRIALNATEGLRVCTSRAICGSRRPAVRAPHRCSLLPSVVPIDHTSSTLRHGAIGLILCAFSFLPSAQAEATKPATVMPEIVRLSFVDGDVRIMRGEDGKKVSGTEWQQAAVDTPIEGGFSLATGAGRAEIEFEDASVAYLAPNSVLMFDQLAARDGVPFSHMQLLSGTMTMRLRPEFPGEQYVLVTPVGELRLGFPVAAYFRVDSYLDAMLVTPLDDGTRKVDPAKELDLKPGESILLHDGNRAAVRAADAQHADANGFDTWVASRLTARDEAMTEMEQEAGLTEPIPGLAEMQGQGTFFDCAPYGRCWEPRDGWRPGEPTPAAPAASEMQPPVAPRLVEAAYQQNVPLSSAPLAIPQNAQQQTVPASPYDAEDTYFPCDPLALRSWYRRDPQTGAMRLVYSARVASPWPYDWAICHSGAWILRNRRYAWVPGRHRHHLCPVRWVKNGGREGFVPLHPKDEPGKTPLNLRYGLYDTKGWKQGDVERVDYDADKPVKVLGEPPKGFDAVPMPRLMPVGEPKMEAHELVATAGAKNEGHEVPARSSETVSIRFNNRTQNFSLAHMEMHGGKMMAVSTPFAGANRGVGVSAVSRGGFGGGGVRGGGGVGGGGVRGGGGSAGGGGGSHGGGGGVASAGGGGGASAGGGAHH